MISSVSRRLLVAVFILVTAGFAQTPRPANFSSDNGASGASLLTEAQNHARQYWDKELTKCGDSYYFVWPKSKKKTEYKEVTFGLLPLEMSSADHLNGFEWRGVAMFGARAFRDFMNGEWGPWQDGRTHLPTLEDVRQRGDNAYNAIPERGYGWIEVGKKSGRWIFSSLGREYAPQSRSCASVLNAAK